MMATKMRRVRRDGCRTTEMISAKDTPPASPIQDSAAILKRPPKNVNNKDVVMWISRNWTGVRGGSLVRFIINKDTKVAR